MVAYPLTLVDGGLDPILDERLINMYQEPSILSIAKTMTYQRPGLVELDDLGDGPIRLNVLWNGTQITVSGTALYRNGALVDAAAFPTDTSIIRYAFSDSQFIIVADKRAYDLSGWTPVEFSVNGISNLIDILFLNSRFIYLEGNNSRFYWSELNDATNVGALNFATAAENTAQKNVGAVVLLDQIVFFLENVIEFWAPTTDPDTPFTRSAGRHIDRGLAAINTLQKADNTLYFLGDDRIVYRLGAVPVKVSDAQVDNKARRVTAGDLANCDAFTVTFGGHVFYVISFPDNSSWACDVTQKHKWAEWKSYGHDNFRGRINNAGLIGDRYSGKVMNFDGHAYTDLSGDAIERIVAAYIPLKAGTVRNFNITLQCKRGVGLITGTDDETDPKVELRYSDEEASDFSAWYNQPLGPIGDQTANAKAIWWGLGMMRPPGRLFEFRVTSPVEWIPYGVVFNKERP